MKKNAVRKRKIFSNQNIKEFFSSFQKTFFCSFLFFPPLFFSFEEKKEAYDITPLCGRGCGHEGKKNGIKDMILDIKKKK